MKITLILFLFVYTTLSAQNINEAGYMDLNKANIRMNSELFKISSLEGEQALILENNDYDETIDEFTGKKKDDVRGGKVALIGEPKKNYIMTVDMKFLGINIDFPGGGWFGFALRAQDFENYEVIWFMPGGTESGNSVAYLPIAHNVAPWWTEAYNTQEKGKVKLPKNDWFTARVEVKGDEFKLFVNNEFVFEKKLTYYLVSGTPGLFVGTATDAAFRRITIEEID